MAQTTQTPTTTKTTLMLSGTDELGNAQLSNVIAEAFESLIRRLSDHQAFPHAHITEAQAQALRDYRILSTLSGRRDTASLPRFAAIRKKQAVEFATLPDDACDARWSAGGKVGVEPIQHSHRGGSFDAAKIGERTVINAIELLDHDGVVVGIGEPITQPQPQNNGQYQAANSAG